MHLLATTSASLDDVVEAVDLRQTPGDIAILSFADSDLSGLAVRLLGGLDWWRYGVERLSSLARDRGIALALLPGEDRDDPRLVEASTLPAHELETLLRFFREGGPENLAALLRRLARHAGSPVETPEPRPVPRTAGYIPGEGAVDLDRLVSACPKGQPCVPIIFYRAMLLAADTRPPSSSPRPLSRPLQQRTSPHPSMEPTCLCCRR